LLGQCFMASRLLFPSALLLLDSGSGGGAEKLNSRLF
jgi:hypothetical protein